MSSILTPGRPEIGLRLQTVQASFDGKLFMFFKCTLVLRDNECRSPGGSSWVYNVNGMQRASFQTTNTSDKMPLITWFPAVLLCKVNWAGYFLFVTQNFDCSKSVVQNSDGVSAACSSWFPACACTVGMSAERARLPCRQTNASLIYCPTSVNKG